MSVPFLDPIEIQRNSAEAGLDEPSSHAFVDFATHIAIDPVLTVQAAAAHHCLFKTSDDCADTIKQTEAALATMHIFCAG